MPKIVIDEIASGYSLSKINEQFNKIETYINDKVLSRDSDGNANAMSEDLDMNSNQILNLPTPVSPTDPIRKQDLDAYLAETQVGDLTLRSDLASVTSTVLVAGVEANNLLGKEELATGVDKIKIVDVADTENHALSIVHFGEGTGSTTQTYGIDISNRPDARTALVVHQYSNVSPAVWIDNTDNQPALRIHNTSNPTLNPGGPTVSEGDYLHFQKAGSTVMRLTHTGTFSATNFSPIFLGNTGTALSVQTPIGVSQDTFTIIRDYPTNAGDAMQITCNGGTGLKVLKNGAGDGLDVVMSAGAAGSYCVKSQGYDYSLLATTTNNGGTTAQITKSGTGNGDAVVIKNAGTGRSLRVTDATNAEKMSIYPDGKLNWVTSNSQTTVGAAGTASSLPAAPSLYLKILFNGLEYVIPAYLA